jgi:CRISPR-associated endonuclease/helicase Cas3
MHVVFVSNCEHAALARTRTLLDRYGQRIGDRAWFTPITHDALTEVHKALRRQASRHTSVACYRSDAVLGLRLEWIVGNHESYDVHGRFAVATERRPKDFPMPLRHAALIARLAGYVHDFGKASRRFQDKLEISLTHHDLASQGDIIRHEWLSAWLIKSLSAQGSPLAVDAQTLVGAWREMQRREGAADGPLDKDHAPVADGLKSATDALRWAVCTHHGAMGGSLTRAGVDGSEHIHPERLGSSLPDHLTLAQQNAFAFPTAPQDTQRWATLFQAISKTAARLEGLERPAPYWEGVMLMARAALIFADHKVSSEAFHDTLEEGILFANTQKIEATPLLKPSIRTKRSRKTATQAPSRAFNQPLSWHLQQVGDRAGENIRMFAGDDLPCVDQNLIRAILEQRAGLTSRFAWQDHAVDHARTLSGGHLVFNVASTGAGKTFANLKLAFAMRPEATRLAVAFNLRSLTTQTFEAFKKDVSKIGMADIFSRDFACLLGERGTITMDFSREDEDDVDGEDVLDLAGANTLQAPEWLSSIAKGRSDDDQAAERLAKLIASPVLVSTMDWIVAAGEPGQQDRHAKAFIRVTSSDLILDEVDSYDVRATVAVMRVVQTAASFGRHVIVSSATLNPELAKGLCLAYAQGRTVHDALFGAQPWHLTLVSDKFAPVSQMNPEPSAADGFYRDTMRTMADGLASEPPTKRYRVVPVDTKAAFMAAIADQAIERHDDTAATPEGVSCRLSIGLVRLANVGPCMEVAESLRADGRFVVTAYHARDVTQRRAWKEAWLDCILRRGDDSWVKALREAYPPIQDAVGDVRLIVVATPVEEVGRDHDFDWAIIEPSSIHSIIQTAGRVNRHRRQVLGAGQTNIVLLSRNLRDLAGEKKAFVKPGLEVDDEAAETTHPAHDLPSLLRTSDDRAIGDILDASLVFGGGDRKTRFAEYDEWSVKIQVCNALKIMARTPGFETHFMTKSYAKKFPLRENDLRFNYLIDIKSDEFRLANNNRPGGGVSIQGGVSIPDTPSSGLWLTPSVRDLETDDRGFLHISLRGNTNIPRDRIVLCWHGAAV